MGASSRGTRPLMGQRGGRLARRLSGGSSRPPGRRGGAAPRAGRPTHAGGGAGGMPDAGAAGMSLHSVAGGYLLQGRDDGRVGPADLKVVTKRAPSERELADLLFAFRVAKHVKSNAIVYAKAGATVGIGAGQM